MGIRYKCAVLKDFDYCSKCEATLEHKHPFLKIRKAGGAPSMIFTVLNEDAEGNPTGDQQPDWKQMKEAFKTVKQQWREQHGGKGCKAPKEWTEEDCQNKAKFFKTMVGGFLNKMGLDKQDWNQGKDWCHKGEWNGKGDYKLRRAVIVSNPDVVLECQPGCVVLHDIQVKNNTHWGWKKGVFLGLDSSVEQKDMPIELINIPVD